MSNRAKNTERAWGIVNEDGDLLLWTIRPGRDRAIGDFCQDPGYDYPESTDTQNKRWRWLKRRGNKCVPLTITF